MIQVRAGVVSPYVHVAAGVLAERVRVLAGALGDNQTMGIILTPKPLRRGDWF